MYESHNIAITIKTIAKEKNIIIKQMLSDCDLGSNTMSAMYHGKSIASDSLAKIADYLNVSVDYLLGRTDEAQLPEADGLPLSSKERRVLEAYRSQPDMQPAVDKLLNIGKTQ